MSRMRVNHAMILNVINQRADPVETMRALMEDNHEDERGRRRLAEQAESLSEELLDVRRAGAAGRARRDGRTLRLAPSSCRTTSRSTSRWRRSRWPRSS